MALQCFKLTMDSSVQALPSLTAAYRVRLLFPSTNGGAILVGDGNSPRSQWVPLPPDSVENDIHVKNANELRFIGASPDVVHARVFLNDTP